MEFKENSTPLKQEEVFDRLNQCRNCGIRPGKYFDKQTRKFTGVFLYADARGDMCCNICKDKGLLIRRQKVGKKERKRLKKMVREMAGMAHIPHITLDRGGKRVE